MCPNPQAPANLITFTKEISAESYIYDVNPTSIYLLKVTMETPKQFMETTKLLNKAIC